MAGRATIGSIIRSVVDHRHALGDVLGIVADPLDHAGDLQRGDHFAQIVGHRRAQRDDPHRELLDLGLDRIDRLVVGDDLAAGGVVALTSASIAASIACSAGRPSRRSGRAAADILVERLDRMFTDHV
jgi:hypothetical protein